MDLIERKFSEVSDVVVAFYTSRLASRPWENHDDLLIIGFKSTQDVNTVDLCFMDAMKLAAATIWRPSAIILDLRELYYKSGDTMQCLFRSPYPNLHPELDSIVNGAWRDTFPIAAVVSDKCGNGIKSLLAQEMSWNPTTILFETLEEAITAIEKADK